MKFETRRRLCLAAGMLISLCTGIGYTWSVFQRPLMEKFGWSLKSSALIFTVQVCVSTLTPMMLGRLQERLKTRGYLLAGGLVYGLGLAACGFATGFASFFVLFGIVVGVGVGMLYPGLMGYGVRIYPDKRGMVAGLLAGSYGAGAILWAPIAASLSSTYGILAVYRILGISYLAAISLLALLLKEPPMGFSPMSTGKKAGGASRTSRGPEVDLDWKAMLRTGRFYLLVVLFALGTTSGLMIMGHASMMLQDKLALAPTAAAYIVGLISICNASGRIAWGALSDRWGRPRVIGILFGIVVLAMIGLYAIPGPGFVGALLIVGACYGGFASIIAPSAADAFGVKNVGVNYGFLYVSYGIGGMIGPQVAAAVREASGGYDPAFLAAAALSLGGLVLTAMFLRKKPRYMNAPGNAG